MRLHAGAGHRDRALRQYQQCRDALRRELEVDPSDETEELRRQITAGEIQPRGAPDAGAPPSSDRHRRWWQRAPARIAAAAMVVLAPLAIVGGLAAVGAFDGGDDVPAYTQHSFHIQGSGPMRVASGDCASSDLVLDLELTGTATGLGLDQVAMEFTTTFLRAKECQIGIARGTAEFRDSTGNSLSMSTLGIASQLQAPNSPASGAQDVPANPVLVTAGGGLHEGATGIGYCQVATSTEMQSPSLFSATAGGDCTMNIKYGHRPGEPLLAGAVASAPTIAPLDSTSGAQREILLGVTFMNDTAEPLRGLRLRLPQPAGAVVEVAFGDRPFEHANEAVLALPDLEPGEVGDAYFAVQLLSSSRPEIAFVVEIDGEDFDTPTLTQPVRVQVVE
jgi:hypothetical protein